MLLDLYVVGTGYILWSLGQKCSLPYIVIDFIYFINLEPLFQEAKETFDRSPRIQPRY